MTPITGLRRQLNQSQIVSAGLLENTMCQQRGDSQNANANTPSTLFGTPRSHHKETLLLCAISVMTPCQQTRLPVFLWYIVLGAVHELSHVLVGCWYSSCSFSINDSYYQLLVGRQTTFDEHCDSTFVRHAGWVVSVGIAVVFTICRGSSSEVAWVATVTAMEALWTDLFGFPTLSSLSLPSAPGSMTYYCGNFGIILIQDAWFKNTSKALDVLQKMVEVTMMRGAQSGGVVTFSKDGNGHLLGKRSRVVNKKRTDLSDLLRRRVWWDTMRKSSIRVYAGHTRFATSSKATFEGTHPQQWSPPSSWSCFDRKKRAFELVQVENYVTHNGDFDFFYVNGTTYDLQAVQGWLQDTTKIPLPADVDSCAVAGLVDVLRTSRSFGLSCRYALALGLSHCEIKPMAKFPDRDFFQKLGRVFEEVLTEAMETSSYDNIDDDHTSRSMVAMKVKVVLEDNSESYMLPLQSFLSRDETDGLLAFCQCSVDSFFDNDLFRATQTFLSNAKGSFGLSVTSTLDSDHQICLASRGQTMAVAFYPRKGLICYGSEAAAVKAGLAVELNGIDALQRSRGDVDNDVVRLDLDDLGGEVMCLDWGKQSEPVSKPNRGLLKHKVMYGAVTVILDSSQGTTHDHELYHRMTRLTRNHLINPLKPDSKDPILQDIQDIPRVLKGIQDDWESTKATTSMNRLSAFTLSRCLRARLHDRVENRSNGSVDILVTGCEVSLWLSEQFASDLQKAFPKLSIAAVSSNKILGLYGQSLSVPCIGFPYAPKTFDLHETIVLIVSQSGGTFAPLACSSLLQSTTRNIFVVTSEWDTQVGKQLRAMDDNDSNDILFNCRIFSTGTGLRTAEPCSLTVAATHQLLTQIFEYISVLILSDERFRHVSGARISEHDLSILERCNRDNIEALGEIVGTDPYGYPLNKKKICVVDDLREAGNLWSEHILENVRAYVLSALYIFGTVVSGYALATSIAKAAGLRNDWIYVFHFVDAMIYFWLPQINVTLIRIVQGRNLLHRMVGRTVVIGDVPWVAQCAEAFLSKVFACSYSIAGLNVLSGNPADHLVHRHTHRVVRGTLLVCGRPDGRLSALSTAEASVCLSVNQACSIQSRGGTCESITIGHNNFELPLSHKGIFLKRKRPLFLCERLLLETDAGSRNSGQRPLVQETPSFLFQLRSFLRPRPFPTDLSMSYHRDSSIRPRVQLKRSAAALLGAFMNLTETSEAGEESQDWSVTRIVEDAIRDRKWSDEARKLFKAFDLDGDGFITEEEFVEGVKRLKAGMSEEVIHDLLQEAEGEQRMDYNDFLRIMNISDLDSAIKMPPSHRDEKGHIQIVPSKEKYFGDDLRKYNTGKDGNTMDFMVARSQEFAMELYESRVASLQRFVSMTVMFHQMGTRVQGFFSSISFGLLAYRMDRTQSILRIATTASPVSGSDVKEQMRRLQLLKRVQNSIHIISMAYLNYKDRMKTKRVAELERHFEESLSPGADKS